MSIATLRASHREKAGKKITFLSVIICAFALAHCGLRDPEDFDRGYGRLHGDSGITRPSYDSVMKAYDDFAAKSGGLMEYVEYGKSVSGKPLKVAKIYDKSIAVSSGSRPALLISEGIHGNEYLNITDRLPEEFLIKKTASKFRDFMAKGGILYMVPILNPDGFSDGARENSNGQDLNRNFTIKAAGNNGFTEPETKNLTAYMAKEAQAMSFTLHASMEYHCCIGGLIHPWAYTSRAMDADQLQRHQPVAAMVKELFGYNAGTVREIVGYDAVGGSDDYYLETYGKRSFSFEGSEGSEHQNLAKHVDLWNRIMEIALNETTAVTTVTPGGITPQPNPVQPVLDPEALKKAIFVAIQPSDILISTDAQYDRLVLCGASVADCQKAGTAATIIAASKKETLGSRTIFQFNGQFQVGSVPVFSLFASSSTNPSLVGARAVKITGK